MSSKLRIKKVITILTLAVVGIVIFFVVFGLNNNDGSINQVISSVGSPIEQVPAFQIKVDHPKYVRMGRTGLVKLTIDITDDLFLKKILSDHQLIFEARLELPETQISPVGTISETYTDGKGISFYWKFEPQSDGVKKGQVWIFARLIPTGKSSDIKIPLASIPIEIISKNSTWVTSDIGKSVSYLFLITELVYLFVLMIEKKKA